MCAHTPSQQPKTTEAGPHAPPADDEYDPLHQDKSPEELTPEELLERFLFMKMLRPILILVTGHDHCPICLGCKHAKPADTADKPQSSTPNSAQSDA